MLKMKTALNLLSALILTIGAFSVSQARADAQLSIGMHLPGYAHVSATQFAAKVEELRAGILNESLDRHHVSCQFIDLRFPGTVYQRPNDMDVQGIVSCVIPATAPSLPGMGEPFPQQEKPTAKIVFGPNELRAFLIDEFAPAYGVDIVIFEPPVGGAGVHN